MDQETKDKWVTALRSGDYLQGRSVLKVRGLGKIYFCCLGVLLEVKGFKAEESNVGFHYPHESMSSIGAINVPNEEMTGLSADEIRKLWCLNDGHEWNFDQIADWIEKNIRATS